MSVISNNQLAGAAGQGGAAAGYEIERSLRFNSGDSAHLSKNITEKSTTFTSSFWLKRSKLGSWQYVWSQYDGSGYCGIGLADDNRISLYNGSHSYSTAVFRDTSAWYHFCLKVSSGSATLYVNNQQVATGTNFFFGGDVSKIGDFYSGSHGLDGYLTDVHFIDGQALAPTDFGEYDDNNAWQPKKFEGSYNTDGYTVSGGAYYTGTSWALALNGSTTGRVMTYSTTSTTATFSPGITWSSQVRIYGVVYGSGYCKVNGGSNITGFGTSLGWVDVTSQVGSSGTLTSLTVGDVGQNYFALYAIELDGTILNVPEKGVNGFHLDFADNSSNAALGTDSSGNNNDWTVNNLSVASGAGNDSLIDTPTNYEADSGNNGGNYCTWNPLDEKNATLSNGNLVCSLPGQASNYTRGTFSVTSGKHYWEVTLNSGVHGMIGISDQHYSGTISYTQGVLHYYINNGSIYGNVGRTGGASSYGSGLVSGDILGVALDMDNGNIKFYKNGTAFSGNANTSTLAGLTISPCLGEGGGAMETTTNFGQQPFAYTPPTGYKSLCTTNLADPTIADGSTAMDVVTYSGNGANGRAITGINHSPDLVWIKARNQTDGHNLFDIVRGTTKVIKSNNTNAELTESNSLTAFNSDGFTVGNNSSNSQVNASGFTYVGWTWDGGTSTVSNTDGSITSSVRANASAGFSIVTGSGNSGTVGHGLNATPDLVIVKQRNNAVGWAVAHSALGAMKDNIIYLNGTAANTNSSNFWGSDNFDSSVFPLSSNILTSGATFVAYCFTAVSGYSSFGKYTGNGSTNGPFVYTGHRSRWLMVKRTDSSGNSWVIVDTARNSFNPVDTALYADSSAADYAPGQDWAAIFSNGFQPRATYGEVNASGATYVYASFAEHPFKTARAR